MTAVFRNAMPADYDAFAELFLELGIEDPVPPAEMFTKMSATCLIAEQDQDVVGYCIYRPTGIAGHINNIVVSRAARGRGIGEGLLRQAAAKLGAAGCATWSLFVKQENEAAKRLYRRLGFKPVHNATVLFMTWSDIDAIQPGAIDEVVIDITVDTRFDNQIARVLDLDEGTLTQLRSRGNFVLKATLTDGEPIAFAGFQPGFPHIRLLRAMQPTTAIALLQQLARHRTPMTDPEHPWRERGVQIFVERQQRLADGFVAFGAEVMLRLVHMSGNLPKDQTTTGERQPDIDP